MKLPTLDDLMPEQWTIYDYEADRSLLVAGPPGSGKTSLAVHRAKFLADSGRAVAFVTRNRMLTASATKLGGGSFEAATMHKLVPKDFTRRSGLWLDSYDWNWDAIEAGCASGLHKPPRWDHLVIDEGQDLPPAFFRWAANYGATALTIFADENQSIGSSGRNERSSLREIGSAAKLTNMLALTHNHRNTPEIAAVAEHFHEGALPPAIVVKRRSGDVPHLQTATLVQVAELAVNRLRNRDEPIGVVVPTKSDAKAVYAAIVARGSSRDRVGLYTSDAGAGEEDTIDLTAPGITVLTSESVKGLEFASVYLVDVSRSLPCGAGDLGTENRRRLYMLCSRAQDMLMLVAHPGPLSAAQLADLPPAHMLKR